MARNGFARIETTAEARGRVQAALERANGHQQKAARLLGVSRSTLQRWLAALKLLAFAAELRETARVPGPRESN